MFFLLKNQTIMTVITCMFFFNAAIAFMLFFSGGSTFTIRGEGFNNVGNITVEKVVSQSSTQRNVKKPLSIYI